MIAKITNNKQLFFKKLILGLFLLSMFFLCIPSSVFAENKGEGNLSLYNRTSELARVFGTSLSPGSKSKFKPENLCAGTAGGLLGYADLNADDKGIVGWLMSDYTAASATMTYEQLRGMVPESGGVPNPYYQYAGYGEALQTMGLSKTIREGGIDTIFRGAATGLTMLLYLASNVAPFLFKIAIMFVSILNPFKLFGNLMGVAAGSDLGLLSTAASYVTTLYELVQNLTLVVLMPMFLVITVASVLLFAQKGALKKFARYALTIFMIFAGLPLIGATYTGIVDDMAQTVGKGSGYADYLILSSYVDFEGWVRETRLAPPEDAGTTIYNPRMLGDEFTNKKMTVPTRDLIITINGNYAGNETASKLKDTYDVGGDLSSIVETGTVDIDDDAEMDQSSFSSTFSLLSRHMTKGVYSGSQYEGEVVGSVQRLLNESPPAGGADEVFRMFSITDTKNGGVKVTWDEKANGLFSPAGGAEDSDFAFPNYPLNIYNAGSLAASGHASGDDNPYKAVGVSLPDGDSTKQSIGAADDATVMGGLSPLAMYNFLNTTFSDTGMTVYSSEKIASDNSRDAYASVLFAGSGVTAFTRWVENITIMFCLSWLSLAFGYAMIRAAIRNLPRVITGIFGTAVGSIAFVTKLLVSVAVMIIQILGTVFLYLLGENIVMGMLINLDVFTANVITRFGSSGVLIEFSKSAIIIALVLFVTKLLIGNLKIFTNIIEEVVSGAIVRIMSGLDKSVGGNGVGLAQATGGRIGKDGHLSKAADTADNAKFSDKMDKLFNGDGGDALDFHNAGKAAVGGVAGILSEANELEKAEEDIKRDNDEDLGDLRSRLDQRAGNASAIAKAKGKDFVRGKLGKDSHEYDDLKSAEDQRLQDMREGVDPTTDPRHRRFQMRDGRRVDKHGNVISDEFGNALDKDGNSISGAAGVSVAGIMGQRLHTDGEGAVLDKDGSQYTDEAGNVFYQNEDGHLTNSNGELMDLDKDGTMQPVGSIPGRKGKPVSARSAAKKLDELRSDSDSFDKMLREQSATSYGMDYAGNAIDTKGKPLRYVNSDGETQRAQLDTNGFVVDNLGNKIGAENVVGKIDPRGFEEVFDPRTGRTHLQHGGDAAIKSFVKDENAGRDVSTKSLTTLARDADVAAWQAQKADTMVSNLVRNNAPAYAIEQARNAQQQAHQTAAASQKRFAGEMLKGGSDARADKAVDDKQVVVASRYAESQKQQFKQASKELTNIQRQGANLTELKAQQAVVQQYTESLATAKQNFVDAQKRGDAPAAQLQQEKISQHSNSLNEATDLLTSMKKLKASPGDVVRQQQVVAALQKDAVAAVVLEQDMKTSRETGRTFNEVRQARNKFDASSTNYNRAQERYDDAVAKGMPTKEIVRRQKVLDGASEQFLQAREKMECVNQAPRVSPGKRDMLKAIRDDALNKRKISESQLVSLQRQAKPDPKLLAKTQRDVNYYDKQYQAATAQYEQAANPKGWSADQTPKLFNVPTVTPDDSFKHLKNSGISDYSSYREAVQTEVATLQSRKARIEQQKQRLSNIGATADATTKKTITAQIQRLTESYNDSKSNLNELQNNAQGFLKTSNFKPPIANKPLFVNGGMVTNKLIRLGNTQAMLNNLQFQEENGTITEGGKDQLAKLKTRMTGMRQELIGFGIRGDSIQNLADINASARVMGQSWSAYMNGEHR